MPSVGLDLVETGRIRNAMKRSRFCRKILGEEEYRQLEKRGFPFQSVAASFSAKEAFSKAIGTGVRGFSLADVELLRRENGKPYLRLQESAKTAAEKAGFTAFSVSVTHTREYAAAVVLAYEKPKNE